MFDSSSDTEADTYHMAAINDTEQDPFNRSDTGPDPVIMAASCMLKRQGAVYLRDDTPFTVKQGNFPPLYVPPLYHDVTSH